MDQFPLPPGPVMPGNLSAQLAHHDAAIVNIASRVTGVESGLKAMQGEMHSSFQAVTGAISNLGSKLEKLDSRPQFDFSKTVGTVTSIAVLFSMVVGGIIWVTTGQFAGLVAEQKSFNHVASGRLDRVETRVEKMADEIGKWHTTTKR